MWKKVVLICLLFGCSDDIFEPEVSKKVIDNKITVDSFNQEDYINFTNITDQGFSWEAYFSDYRHASYRVNYGLQKKSKSKFAFQAVLSDDGAVKETLDFGDVCFPDHLKGEYDLLLCLNVWSGEEKIRYLTVKKSVILR